MHPDADVKPMDAVVMLLDGTEFEIPCKNGKYTTAEELHELVARRLNMAAEYSSLFAVWVISGSLNLQLKPHHQPFKVLKQWADLLLSYSLSGAYELPVLYFKRAALVHQGVESRIEDPLILKLLVAELEFNVQYSLYPCEPEEAARLAAIHLHMAVGSQANKSHVENNSHCHVPLHLEKAVKTKAWTKMVLEQRLLIDVPAADKIALYKKYLEIGRTWPYYGSVFFFGHIEQPHVRHVLRERPDELVRVGVNIDGIHIIADHKNKVRLTLGYDELMYNSYNDSASGDACFLMEHAVVDDKGISAQHHTVVWTKQAQMIDTLVTQYVDLANQHNEEVFQRRNLQRGLAASAFAAPRAHGRIDQLQRVAGSTLARLRTVIRRDGPSGGMFTLGRQGRSRAPPPAAGPPVAAAAIGPADPDAQPVAEQRL